MNLRNYIRKAMTFAEYEMLIDDLLAEGKTTGLKKSGAMFDYSKHNRRRMLRLKRTVVLGETVRVAIKQI